MRIIKSLAALNILAIICFAASSCNAKSRNDTQGTGKTVIELFTSEGCSSCPKADKTVAELQQQYKDRLLVLCYHVDYWNYLGWTDIFSSAANTQRQQYYTHIFRLNSAYTPQAIINGGQECVGSDKSKLTTAVEKGEMQNNSLALSAKLSGNNITVNTVKRNTTAIICLVQKEATTQVRKGENEGRSLHHINLVRDFISLPASMNSAVFALPFDLKKEQYFVAMLLQDEKTGKITGWTTADIQ